MDKTEYDRIITDFYSKSFIEISLREGANYATKDAGKMLNQFIDGFNNTLASNFLTKLHQTYPSLEEKVNNYPEHFWRSEQGEDLLKEKLHHLTGKLIGHESRYRPQFQFGEEPASFTPLNLAKFINISLQVGRGDFAMTALNDFSNHINHFQQISPTQFTIEEEKTRYEKFQRNIQELQASIEWDLKDTKSAYLPEVKEVLLALKMNVGWDEPNKKQNEKKSDNRKPKV